MLRVLILGSAAAAVLCGIVVVSPILEGSIELEPFVASVESAVPQFTDAAAGETAPSCIISAHPEVISGGQSSNIAWGSENAVAASFSGTGPVPVQSGISVSPSSSITYTLTVRSSSGRFAYCATRVIVR